MVFRGGHGSVLSPRNGCRLKEALVSMHNVGRDNVHDDRSEQSAANQRPFTDVKWTSSPHGWWRCLRGRSEKVRMKTAASFLRFVRAYVVAVKSGLDNTTDSDLRETCAAIQARLDASLDAGGDVSIAAVIESFSVCSRIVFFDMLCLLCWAGHIQCGASLSHYNAAMVTIVDTYWRHAQNSKRCDKHEVRPQAPVPS